MRRIGNRCDAAARLRHVAQGESEDLSSSETFGSQQTQASGSGHRLGAPLHFQLVEDAPIVPLDRVQRQEEPLPDLVVRETCGDTLCNGSSNAENHCRCQDGQIAEGSTCSSFGIKRNGAEAAVQVDIG